MSLESVFERFEEQLMAIPQVTSVGISERLGEEAILIFVKQRIPDLYERIPAPVRQYPIHIIETGEMRADVKSE